MKNDDYNLITMGIFLCNFFPFLLGMHEKVRTFAASYITFSDGGCPPNIFYVTAFFMS